MNVRDFAIAKFFKKTEKPAKKAAPKKVAEAAPKPAKKVAKKPREAKKAK